MEKEGTMAYFQLVL